jgi:hypothetical protein
MRCLLVLALWTTAAAAAPDFAKCADAELAGAPDTDLAGQAELALHGPSEQSWADREKKALADKYDPLGALLRLAERAAETHDTKRVAHLAELMETTAKSLSPPTSERDPVTDEANLADAQALAGRSKEAHAHFVTAEAIVAKGKEPTSGAIRELWTAALLMHDDALAAREQKAYFATRSGKSDFAVDAKIMAYHGVGRALLPLAGNDQKVLHAMIEGARNDDATTADILRKLDVRQRVLDLSRIWSFADYAPGLVAMTKETLAQDLSTLDDFALGELVEVAADLGFTGDATALAARIQNPWQRAASEAEVAAALALTDKPAAIAMAHAAVARSATKGARTNVDNDKSAIDTAKWKASIALARAGKLAEAKKLGKVSSIDEMFGLRDDPKQLVAWWKRTGRDYHAWVFARLSKHDPRFGDGAYLEPFCH